MSNHIDKYLFSDIDFEMNELAKASGGQVSFLNLKSKFITGNRIDMSLFKEYEPRGIVHLSIKGASMLAETLKNYLMGLHPNKFE